MPKPIPEFRINPERSIQVCGEINDDMASRLLPEISALRMPPNSHTPITVFINSIGGDIHILDLIDAALNGKDQDGLFIPVVTAAVGDAASAAAYLLVFGDYAIAYPKSEILLHGSRYGELRHVTAEGASNRAEALRRTNLDIAYHLATRMMPRMVHRYAIVKNKFKRRRKGVPDPHLADLEGFVLSIQSKLRPRIFNTVYGALEHVRDARGLMRSVLPNVTLASRGAPIKNDEKVLCALIRHEIKTKKNTGWALDEDGISTVVNDYLLLRDYQLGDHRRAMKAALRQFGVEFLTLAEYRRFHKLAETDEKAGEDYLKARAHQKVEPFWYFAIILCRRLLKGENPLTAEEAYWIGAIDEVVGMLHGKRLEKEKEADKIPIDPSASAPPPPSLLSPTVPSQ